MAGLTLEQVLVSPDYLIGSVDQNRRAAAECLDRVAVYQRDLETMAPGVARLAGS